MFEQQLTDELHRVGDQLDVPPDLYPTKRITLAARPWWRRPAMTGVAVAAALALIVGLTPAGQRTVLAATNTTTTAVKRLLIWRSAVRLSFSEDGKVLVAAPVGELVTQTLLDREGQYEVRVAHQVLTVADLKQQKANFPLPTYLPPADSDRVELETYRKVSGEQPERVHMYLFYSIPEKGSMTLQLNQWDGAAAEAEGARSTATREVTVGGRPAAAFTNGVHWTITWVAPAGVMELSGNLPLEELLKVAESIPQAAP